MMSAGTFTCDECGKTFDKEWSDEEAMAEAHDVFGDLDEADMAVVCDDCYLAVMGLTDRVPAAQDG